MVQDNITNLYCEINLDVTQSYFCQLIDAKIRLIVAPLWKTHLAMSDPNSHCQLYIHPKGLGYSFKTLALVVDQMNQNVKNQ